MEKPRSDEGERGKRRGPMTSNRGFLFLNDKYEEMGCFFCF